MRITNNMISSNTKSNINNNKVYVDKYNTQMTTQKKIQKPSDDPVIAIRSLRLGTSLSQINQYATNNIPDADAWLDVTETALTNMKNLVTDIRTQCVNGSTDTLNASDRQVILQNLQALVDQVYTEGNADYAGRTVFTGYRTTENLTFDADTSNTKYAITQKFDSTALEEHRYYGGNAQVPTDITNACTTEITKNTYERIRLAYDGVDSPDGLSYSYGEGDSKVTVSVEGNELKDNDGNVVGAFQVYDNENDWAAVNPDGSKTVDDDSIVFIKSSGEFIFGKNIAESITTNHCSIEAEYTKTGFAKGELRPEYYYDCRDITDPTNVHTYTKEEQVINYEIANSTLLPVNTQASDVFDSSIQRDTKELINIVKSAIDAETKVNQITQMMQESRFEDEESQKMLETYLNAAKKEADYANDNLQKTYAQYISNFDNYLENINEAITNVGSTQRRLQMVQTRVENQQTTIQGLKSSNEDRDISEIIIDYYAAYNAYQASLTAASKVGDQTLLNYL